MQKGEQTMNKYVCYESDFERSYTNSEMNNLYNLIIHKAEYPYFEDWLCDMLKSGIFVKEG